MNSANEQLFKAAAGIYQDAFKNAGYDYQLNYEPFSDNPYIMLWCSGVGKLFKAKHWSFKDQ